MTISRAGFLESCGVAVLGSSAHATDWLWLPGDALAVANVGWTPATFRVEDASASVFRPHVQTAFVVRPVGGSRVRLILARVTDGVRHTHSEQFSLIFHGPPGASALHGTHVFQHQALGEFELFIVPIGSNPQRTVYEICFSRLVKV